MVAVLDAIKGRRNTKKFKPDMISEKDLLVWLEAASYAPNHRMTEPWEIVRIGPDTRAKLNHKTDFGGAPVVLAVLSKSASTPLERDENVMAVSCFIQNFMLAAHEAGIGVFWSSIGASPQNREVLGVADGDDVVGVLGIGYPEEVPEVKPRTPIALKITQLS